MKKLLLSAAAVALLAGGGAWWAARPAATVADLSLPGAANAQESMEDIDTSSVVEMTLGSESATVTVIEYASFTCPHCASFHGDQFKKLKADYIDTGKVRYIYRDVYFDRFGLWAGMVARCGGPERFFGISDMLYDQQRNWIGDASDMMALSNRLRKIGITAGLGADQVDSCLNDAENAKTLVAWFQKNATADDIRSTPSVIVNGTKMESLNYSTIKAVIDKEIAQ